MNARLFFRAIVILLLLFVVLYIGMSNTHRIDFYFPILLERKLSQPGALIFFGMFAIGLIAGMMLNPRDKESAGGEPRKKRG